MSDNNFGTFIMSLEEHHIAQLEWTIWYDSDEYQFNDDPIVIGEDGNQIDVVKVVGTPGNYTTIIHPAFQLPNGKHNGEVMESWKEYLWDIADKFDKTGVFRLNVKERNVQKVADASIPDSDVEIDPIDPVELKFSLDSATGLFDGPFHPTWSEKDKNSPYLVQFFADPTGFKPRETWGSPYENMGGKKNDMSKAGWVKWEEHPTAKKAIHQANCWHQNGSSYGEVKYPKPGEGPIKGVTAARVLDAWDNEIYVVNTKGIVKDRRGPFKIQIQEYKRTINPAPYGWTTLVAGRPAHHKFPDIQEEYKSIGEAYQDIEEYVSLNGGEDFKYFIRIIDNSGSEVEFPYRYKSPDYNLSNREVMTYHISSKPIPADHILLELHSDDLYQLAAQIKVKEQHDWATQYARDLFGDEAYIVRVTVVSEYNDQGYDDVIEDIEVSDKDGNILSFDRKKVEAYIDSDFDRQVRNYIMYGGGDDDLHLLPGKDPKVFLNDVDGHMTWIDYSMYAIDTNDSFYEYIKDDGMDDYLYDIKNSVDITGLSGDYIVGEYMPTDDRWKAMRLFTLTPKG
jgi:hypothetical protein